MIRVVYAAQTKADNEGVGVRSDQFYQELDAKLGN
jgi:hypothetical protein